MEITILLLAIIGLAAATFGSIVGLGGGIILVPGLIYLGPLMLGKTIDAQVAVATSLAVLIFTSLSSTLAYRKVKRVDWRSGIIYFITSGPASMLGAALTQQFKNQSFELAFGFFMLAMAILMVMKDKMKPLNIRWSQTKQFTDGAGVTSEYGQHVWVMLLIGFMVGLVSGLFGIGGGSLFVPLMVLLFRYPAHVATATSMFVIFLSSILGTTVHAWNGSVDWLLVAILAPSAWIGGKLGAMIANKMSGKGLLLLLRLTLLILSIRMIVSGLLAG
ncbi:sulfite exporter TauE/SafE family protein [Paenibacillus sp. ACRRX]|uniref:sulfite exporter TauE/SafE family protein n=1 Tax=unclassified Paenibacillus TaxID=185978 RepID=UPI001EF53750|nr:MULTISPECIES: sulfite exporter TauE/SafE family protein [unclassified Paenibacillus]MCG7408480.1 sulfite exporter TauE/SafE family protein [Paenibacillus sp. ACRRX]MDK8182718.1 sulfite exporter TauE/SafE family protein [Paenibacillus sp. UMB4589-SE434]